jgi:hypothetical protein
MANIVSMTLVTDKNKNNIKMFLIIFLIEVRCENVDGFEVLQDGLSTELYTNVI